MPRPFAPLAADHPCVGDPCAVCDRRFVEGDVLTLLPKGDAPVDGLTVEAAPMHWRCLLRVAMPYADPDPSTTRRCARCSETAVRVSDARAADRWICLSCGLVYVPC